MKIYFDNILIDEDFYVSLTNTHNLFNGNFMLGSTASNTFTLVLDITAVSSVPEVVKITENDEDFATLVVDKVEDVDKFSKSYKLTDKLVDLNYYYDASEFINQNGGSALTSEILADMCSNVGIEVDENINWINDIPVTWYDNTVTAREYAGYIAEINAGYISILPNGKLTIKQHNMASKYTINVDDCEDFTLGERHIITKVVYDNGIVKYEAGDDTGNTLYIDANNLYITSQEQITNIYNAINGFEFYSVETGNCPINSDIRAGDVITFVDGDNEYPTIANINLQYYGGWFGGYSLDINTEKQEETDVIGTNNKIRGIITRLNRDEAQLEIVATESDENSQKIGQLELNFEEINLKVSEITDFIVDVTNMGTVTLENAYESVIKSLSISGAISLLFGNDGQTYGTNVPYAEVLYPSSDLYGKNMNLIHEYEVVNEDETTTEQEIIALPFTYLNYLDSTTYDEFVLENSIAKIIRRVGINSDMELYALDNEVIEELGEITIALKQGTNKLYLQCFSNAILKASYVTQNEFTDNFVTHSEFNAGLDITSTSIKQEVNAQIEGIDGEIQNINGSLELKLDKNDNDQVVSMLNASADIIHLKSNRFILESEYSNIDQDGIVDFRGGKIGGFNLTEEKFSVDVSSTYNYTQADVDRIQQIILNDITPSYTELMHLDVNGDGIINALDLGIVSRMVAGTTSSTISGKFEIRTDESQRCVVILNDSNQIASSMGIDGIYSDSIHANQQVSAPFARLGETQCSTLECSGDASANNLEVRGSLEITHDLTVFGTKNRLVITDNYGKRLLNAYETATPYFGDIGSDTTDENGYCKIIIEDIFKETIELDDYKVFIQECGEGHLYVKKYTDYFEVHGTPNLEFDWEIKAVQKGYKDVRLKESQIKESDKNGKNTI